ncbi:Ankyrin repeat domain-containing protein 50-like protein 3 [Phlyctema vagabunda]|uniref:Ankyrin repeat domain-containing protein 50-like protein 3 n=1 Tax=Phlyctema vagabunda TaxID=108571 RepID=A0ABR4PIX8_9HELO
MKLTTDQYTVAWLCALPESEQVAARLVLDEKHEAPSQTIDDENSYFFGSINGHNIVVACLPPGQPGVVSASKLVGPMMRSFPSLKIYLFVGIGGGVPHDPPMKDPEEDIHLGDVVVGYSEEIGAPAVVQWDFGRSLEDGQYQNTSYLNKPDRRLSSALGLIITNQECGETKFDQHLNKIISKNAKFACPGGENDKLFSAKYLHGDANDCSQCDPSSLVHRPKRLSTNLVFHRSTIVSGNSVMKNGVERDKISKRHNDARCFEMEAAGVMDETRCLVIRGIADYADGHKNWQWHRYAAAAAASFAKEFLLTLRPVVVENLTPAKLQLDPVIVKGITEIKQSINEQTRHQVSRYDSEDLRKCHQCFKSSKYEEFKNNNIERAQGTCEWVLTHPKYISWQESRKDNLLWISADPGCGKSVLARSLVDKELRRTESRSVCYFFFKENEEQDKLSIALCALLHQLFAAQPQLLGHAIPNWKINGEKLQHEVTTLWNILIGAATDPNSHEVICVLDALDECQEDDRLALLRFLSRFYTDHASQSPHETSLKFLVTSRPYADIEFEFLQIPASLPTIHLSGEMESDKIGKEIDLVIRERVKGLAYRNSLSETTSQYLEQWLLKMENRTYLWLHFAMHSIEDKFRTSLQPDSESIESLELPSSINDAYEKILRNIKSSDEKRATTIFHIILGARRPLLIGEIAVALQLAMNPDADARFCDEFKVDEVRAKAVIRGLCGLFVIISHSRIYLIHQTAKEFLVQNGPHTENDYWKYRLIPRDSETTMLSICMTYLSLLKLNTCAFDNFKRYLQERSSSIRRTGKIEYEFDLSAIEGLLEYVAVHWASHLRNSFLENESPIVEKIYDLYQLERTQFDLWFPIFWEAHWPYDVITPLMNDIKLAAVNNHDAILSSMLDRSPINVDEADDDGQTALNWAAQFGHQKIVGLLLDHQADINIQGGEYGTALQAASAEGHKDIVQLLLDHQADINIQGGEYGTALQAASARGYKDIVQLLLDHQADINIQGGEYGTALQEASAEGHKDIVQLLLDHQADINIQGGEYGTALQAASTRGHKDIVQLLLDHQADINIEGGYYGTALQAASTRGHKDIVQLLLDHQADINIQGSKYDTALQAASTRGHKDIVQLLLDHQADVNAQGGAYGTALQAASAYGYKDIVQLLLDHQADVNALGPHGTALHIALHRDDADMIKLLRGYGAVDEAGSEEIPKNWISY